MSLLIRLVELVVRLSLPGAMAAGAPALIPLARSQPSVPAFLAALPPALLRDPVLIYNSRSTQKATPDFPRVVLFETDVMLTYNGLPGSIGFEYVEMIQYDRARGAFDFYRLRFTDDGVKVDANPEQCQFCHRGRPIWPSNYVRPAWPGVYGSGPAEVTGGRERELLERFIDGARHNPRYAVLPQLEKFKPYGTKDETHALFASNGRFEDTLADTMGHYMLSELRRGERFAEAAEPLIRALGVGTGDQAGELSQLATAMDLTEDVVRGRLTDARFRVAFQMDIQARAKCLRLISGLELPTGLVDAIMAPVDPRRIDQLTAIGVVLQHYGYGDLMGRLFSNNDWLGVDPPGGILAEVRAALVRERPCERALDGRVH